MCQPVEHRGGCARKRQERDPRASERRAPGRLRLQAQEHEPRAGERYQNAALTTGLRIAGLEPGLAPV